MLFVQEGKWGGQELRDRIKEAVGARIPRLMQGTRIHTQWEHSTGIG
jgi:hypothetical protein